MIVIHTGNLGPERRASARRMRQANQACVGSGSLRRVLKHAVSQARLQASLSSFWASFLKIQVGFIIASELHMRPVTVAEFLR